jgi:hypothetical protein
MRDDPEEAPHAVVGLALMQLSTGPRAPVGERRTATTEPLPYVVAA